MNIENLLSRVDNLVFNGDDERGCDENWEFDFNFGF